MVVCRFNVFSSSHTTHLIGTRVLAVNDYSQCSICQAGRAVALVTGGIEIVRVVDDDLNGVHDGVRPHQRQPQAGDVRDLFNTRYGRCDVHVDCDVAVMNESVPGVFLAGEIKLLTLESKHVGIFTPADKLCAHFKRLGRCAFDVLGVLVGNVTAVSVAADNVSLVKRVIYTARFRAANLGGGLPNNLGKR